MTYDISYSIYPNRGYIFYISGADINNYGYIYNIININGSGVFTPIYKDEPNPEYEP